MLASTIRIKHTISWTPFFSAYAWIESLWKFIHWGKERIREKICKLTLVCMYLYLYMYLSTTSQTVISTHRLYPGDLHCSRFNYHIFKLPTQAKPGVWLYLHVVPRKTRNTLTQFLQQGAVPGFWNFACSPQLPKE